MNPAQRSSVWYVTGLLMVGLVTGRVLPPLAVRMSGQAPIPQWSAALVLLAGGILVSGIAWHTWRTLHKDKKTIAARHAIRVLAIAKASIIVGGVFAGGYLGFALAYWGVETELGPVRFWRVVAAGVAGLTLLAAALVLEWTCRLPEDDDEDTATDAFSGGDPSPA